MGGRKGIWPVKTEQWGAGMVICLERGADLHMAQLTPLTITVSCFSKIQIGFAFLVPAHPGSPGKRPLNGCVCVCVLCALYVTHSLCFLCCNFTTMLHCRSELRSVCSATTHADNVALPACARRAAVQQSTDISCRLGHNSEVCGCGHGWDRLTNRQTDA